MAAATPPTTPPAIAPALLPPPLLVVTTGDELDGEVPVAVREAEEVAPPAAVDSGRFLSARAFAAVALKLSDCTTSA